MERPNHVVQLDDLEWLELDSGPVGLRCKQLGQAAGSKRLGCTFYEIPPGKRPCPYHWHEANEEAFYVLSGRGTLRLAGETLALEAGDYVACPPPPKAGSTVGTLRGDRAPGLGLLAP